MKKKLNLIVMAAFLLISCERTSDIRKYQEVVIAPEEKKQQVKADPHAGLDMNAFKAPMPGMQSDDPAVAKMLADSLADVPLTWSTPEGWIETKGSGMRLATLKSSDTEPIECTIVSLGGAAGGLEANVTRWLGQIQISLTAQELQDFLSKHETITTEKGLQLPILNFTQLQNQSPESANSMAATIFNVHESSVFIKMTGSKKAVLNNIEKFKTLCRSIKLKNEQIP